MTETDDQGAMDEAIRGADRVLASIKGQGGTPAFDDGLALERALKLLERVPERLPDVLAICDRFQEATGDAMPRVRDEAVYYAQRGTDGA
ncbi:hypothetical protein [Poseidonocella sp. HB161398]|uniref:hypothetical protein n=1 Tax=Poseidonocella sp. HB161398 TaxID=2320855 RepID=UPI001108BDD8|nr:hypothetical protein [Poseidonocella sp. HB161398]